MFVLRLAETAAGLQWYEMTPIIILGLAAIVIVAFGGFMAYAARPGIGLLVAAFGVTVLILALAWAFRGLNGFWLLLPLGIAALGVIIEIVVDDGPFGLPSLSLEWLRHRR